MMTKEVEAIDPALVARMAAFVRRCDDLSQGQDVFVGAAYGNVEEQLQAEARDIARQLPDTDQREAAALLCELEDDGYMFANPQQAEALALAAIKRGRELAQEPTA